MPLFARTEKRLKRKEREDELGITAVKDAMKENGELGGSDSEEEEDLSDESESEDEDEDEEEEEEDDEGDEDEDDEEDQEAGDGASQDDEDEGDDDGSGSGSEGEEEPFPLTIEEVESNPIYPMEEHEGCLLCPGKTLKNDKMRETHLASTSHKRAKKRWTKRIAQQDERPLPSDDPRDVMNEILDDLEDRKAGQPPTAVATSDPKAGAEGVAAKRRKGDSKKARQQARAEEALKAAGAGTGAGGEGQGLNRKARRLLAKLQGGGATAAVTTTKAKADTGTPKEKKQEKKGKKQRKT